jgi:Uncharacterized protein conserved in bacteria (DUF2272)
MVDASLLPAIRAALRENEIGDQSPYVLSYAELGSSGGSFGVFQGDACVDPNARAALKQVLVAAKVDSATVTRIVNAVSQPCPNGSPLSPADQKTADNALNSPKGRAIVDAMDDKILQIILNELDTSIAAAQSVKRQLDPGSQISVALWVNMTGAPTSLNEWIQGETMGGVAPPAAATVTRNDLKRYLQGTKFFTLHPKNLIHFEASVDAGLSQLPAPASGPVPAAAMAAAPAQFIPKVVQTATEQWEFFGEQTYDIDGRLLQNGHKEGEEGFYQRVGQYWLEGTNTRNIDGRDHDYPWSAAFISWMMKSSGAGDNFRYSTQHSVYINQAIRDHQNNNNVGFWGWRLNEYKPAVGDLVCWAREAGVDFDHQKGGNYAGHCDIVVEVDADEMFVIGGNVGDSVTRRPLSLDNGFLTARKLGGETLFAIMENRVPLLGAVA